MRRLTTAPNLAIATLWVDLLRQGGIGAQVLRAHGSSIAGEIPPDQALPEVWVLADHQLADAGRLLDQLRNLPHVQWHCRRCGEFVDGPFEQCWNCGAQR